MKFGRLGRSVRSERCERSDSLRPRLSCCWIESCRGLLTRLPRTLTGYACLLFWLDLGKRALKTALGMALMETDDGLLARIRKLRVFLVTGFALFWGSPASLASNAEWRSGFDRCALEVTCWGPGPTFLVRCSGRSTCFEPLWGTFRSRLLAGFWLWHLICVCSRNLVQVDPSCHFHIL